MDQWSVATCSPPLTNGGQGGLRHTTGIELVVRRHSEYGHKNVLIHTPEPRHPTLVTPPAPPS